MASRIELVGMGKLKGLIAKAGEDGPRVLASGLFVEATLAFNRSQDLVPVQTGALRGSGYVHPPVIFGDFSQVEITYGGPAVDYALTVHEDMEMHHHDGQQAKYLEQPVVESVAGMTERLAEQFERRTL